MPDIAGNKYSWNAGFEIEGIAIRGPPGRAPAISQEMLARYHVTLNITFDDPGEPIGAGNGAGVNQQRAGRYAFPRQGLVVLNGDPLASVRTFHIDHT